MEKQTIEESDGWRSDGTVNRRLLDLDDVHIPTSSAAVNGVVTSDHTVDAARQLWFRLFLPVHVRATAASSSQLPVIIYFHGGGFVQYSASVNGFDNLCRRIAGDSPAVVISVNYRLAPEHKFPAQYDDGFDVVKFVDCEIRKKVGEFPVSTDLRRCFLAGDSAGGNIVHHVAVRCSGVELKEVKIRGLVIIQPFFGGEVRTDSEIRFGNGGRTLRKSDFYWKAFLPNGSDRNHPAANVFGPELPEDNTVSRIGYPETLVVVGGLDFLQDRQRSYVGGLRRSGKEVEVVEYPNACHGFCCFAESPDYDSLITKVREFVQKTK